MAKFHVEMHRQEKAVFEIEAPEGATEAEAEQMALDRLSASGGAEWDGNGYTQTWRLD